MTEDQKIDAELEALRLKLNIPEPKTLKEVLTETKDPYYMLNEFHCCVYTNLDFKKRAVYWDIKDFRVSGVVGNQIYLRMV